MTRLIALLLVPLWLCGCTRPALETKGDAKGEVPRPAALRFEDGTERSGLRFRHQTGGTGRKYLPETMGPGAAFLDFDGDGLLDLFLLNGGALPSPAPAPAYASRPVSQLYRGLGEGRFRLMGPEIGLLLHVYGMGCAVGDYDDDGDDDLYVCALGDNRLLRNDGGVFRDVTRETQVAGGRWRDAQGREHPEWSTSAAFADLDGDGDLDLFVVNYVAWSPETEIFTTFDGKAKVFTTPDAYPGLPCRYYENLGGGRFADRSEAFGLLPHRAKGLGLTIVDLNDDGRQDVFVANDTQANFLFLNRGDRFEEAGLESGVAYDEDGRARAGMGVSFARLGEAERPGILIGNFSNEAVSLYAALPGGEFRSSGKQAGLGIATVMSLTFGLLCRDLNLDGWPDLVLANGHVEPEIARYRPEERHAQLPQLFLGDVRGGFHSTKAEGADSPFARPLVGRALLSGDVDGDGDEDLLMTNNGGAPRLFLNRAVEDGRPSPLVLRLRGKGGNRHGVGARVTLDADGRRRTRTLLPADSYLSVSEPALRFPAPAGDAQLEVLWPSGKVTRRSLSRGVNRLVIAEE